jgi:hypothetical protein
MEESIDIVSQNKVKFFKSSLFSSFLIDLIFIWPIIYFILSMDSLLFKIIFSILIAISFTILFIFLFYVPKNEFLIKLLIIKKEKESIFKKLYYYLSTIIESSILIYYEYYILGGLWFSILLLNNFKDYKFKKIYEKMKEKNES